MKMFNGARKLGDIIAAAQTQGVPIDARKWHEGSAYIVFGTRPFGYVMFNTFNGNFFGETPLGVAFNSKDTAYENKPWFQALLSFFYEE